MVNLNRVQWNEPLICKMFFKEEANLIMSIPLSLFDPPDELIWVKEPRGNFTTKSTYFVARSCSEVCGDIPIGSATTEEIQFLWKAMWLANVSSKVKICIWMSCLNALPTRVNLKKRKILVDDCCPFCNNTPETIEHDFLHYSRVATIWFSSPLGLQTLRHREVRFQEWLSSLALTLDNFDLVLVLLWKIWTSRNELIWMGSISPPHDIQLQAQTCLIEFKKWNVVPKHNKPIDPQQWRTPLERWLKCNFDGAWDVNATMGGVGVIIRNAAKEFVTALAMRLASIGSSMQAEVATAWEAAVFALQWRADQVILEGDTLLVVVAIQNNVVANQRPFGLLLEDTRRIMQSFKWWKACFVR
ncbi:uncharacterized protein LOC126601507 [Malus sylvestris]|uniref:uncharacterized protein LOC126601507 n=1 Tax=Malus sylvestris TaxID=3752 RepID=UPI0021AD0E79|nr:uncharacterized protein LOC126601507 [Malus sylvestris]